MTVAAVILIALISTVLFTAIALAASVAIGVPGGIQFNSVAAVPTAIRRMGKLLGREDEAEAQAGQTVDDLLDRGVGGALAVGVLDA